MAFYVALNELNAINIILCLKWNFNIRHFGLMDGFYKLNH